jgi:hypothetical protein
MCTRAGHGARALESSNDASGQPLPRQARAPDITHRSALRDTARVREL